MIQKLINKSDLKQELNEIIKEVKTMDIPQSSIEKRPPLQLTLEKFIKISFFIVDKAHECDFLYYGNMVKTFGLALEYILEQKIPSSNKVIAFITWCNRKRMMLTGWGLEDFSRIDVGEITKDEFNKLAYDLSPYQQMTFLGIHNAYRYFTEVINNKSFDISELKEDWLELLKELKEHAIEIPLDIDQGTIQA